jgi:hypothetical protein
MKRRNEIALVTANFGGIDDLKPLPARRRGVSTFYYTDRGLFVKGWDKVSNPNYPRHDFNNRLRARYFKHQIHRLDEVQDYRWLVWADSIIDFRDTDFLLGWAKELKKLPKHKRILAIQHPLRATVVQEYEFISGHIKQNEPYLTRRYQHEKMTEQMRWFDCKGWKVNVPLLLGTIWMVENSKLMAHAFDDWWDQNLRFGMMDQLSFYPVLAHNKIKPQIKDLKTLSKSVAWTTHRVSNM